MGTIAETSLKKQMQEIKKSGVLDNFMRVYGKSEKKFQGPPFVDLMELTLYNSILSGISLDGEKYFYVNPHASNGRSTRLAKIS